MEYFHLTSAFASTILGIIWLVPLTYKLGLTDKPCERKQHEGTIPLVGGLAIHTTVVVVALLLIPVTIELLYILLAASLVVFTGALDDRYDISFKIRLVIQAIAALIIIYGAENKLTSLGSIFGLGEIHLGYLSTPITVIAFLAIINAFNMIDGIDGLAGGLALIAFIAMYYTTYNAVSDSTQTILLLFIGALFAYLLFNLHLFPNHLPKVFLGDAGSNLLGFVICIFLVRYTQENKAILEPTTALWFVAVPLIDMVTTALRRVRHKKSPFFPDRTHVHHILMRARFTKESSLLVILAISSILTGCGIILEKLYCPPLLSLTLFIATFLLYSLAIGKAWRLSKLISKNSALKRAILRPKKF